MTTRRITSITDDSRPALEDAKCLLRLSGVILSEAGRENANGLLGYLLQAAKSNTSIAQALHDYAASHPTHFSKRAEFPAHTPSNNLRNNNEREGN